MICAKKKLIDKILSQCMKYCPKDCIDFEIKQAHILEFVDFGSRIEVTKYSPEVNAFWDKNHPLISYIETAVMSFTEYLCYCGGLLGLWFGTNAYQVISFVNHSINWISLKYKLRSFGRIVIAMICRTTNIVFNFILNFRIRLTIDISW
jgi:hypothetical protein